MNCEPAGAWWFEYRQVFATLGGIVIGFALATAREWWTKRRECIARWGALAAEVDLCRKFAQGYIGGGVNAPSYRLPVMAFEEALPKLLAAGKVNAQQYEGLMHFFLQVETINRGLDQIHDSIGDSTRIAMETNRLVLKCTALIGPKYDDARAAIGRIP